MKPSSVSNLKQLALFVTAPRGIEEALSEEIVEIFKLTGIRHTRIAAQRGGVRVEGPLEAAYAICLHSRLAHRVILELKQFAAYDPERLYRGVGSVDWSEHFSGDCTLAVEFTAGKNERIHTQFGAQKTKDAIVDQFRERTGARPSVDRENPDILISVHIEKSQAILGLDLSGGSLHQRGYRLRTSVAPLRETLAAALLHFARWPARVAGANNGEGGTVLIDPMCGSGTIAIEAALIATRTAPGLVRLKQGLKFGFQKWKHHDSALWQRLAAEAETRRELDPARVAPIYASDSDSWVLHIAKENAERAGMLPFIRFEHKDFRRLKKPVLGAQGEADSKGILVFNPPYGERLNEVETLAPLYQAMGERFKHHFAGWTGFVLAGHSGLAAEIGLKASRRFPVWNGPIECRLLQYDLYEGSVKRPPKQSADGTSSAAPLEPDADEDR